MSLRLSTSSALVVIIFGACLQPSEIVHKAKRQRCAFTPAGRSLFRMGSEGDFWFARLRSTALASAPGIQVAEVFTAARLRPILQYASRFLPSGLASQLQLDVGHIVCPWPSLCLGHLCVSLAVLSFR